MPILTRKNRKMQEYARINGREANVLQQISTPDENGFIPILNLIANINEITSLTLMNKEQLSFNQLLLNLRLANVNSLWIACLTSQNNILKNCLANLQIFETNYNLNDKSPSIDTELTIEIINSLQIKATNDLQNLTNDKEQLNLLNIYTNAILSYQNSTFTSTIGSIPSLANYATLMIQNYSLDLNILYVSFQTTINQILTDSIELINNLDTTFDRNGVISNTDNQTSHINSIQSAITLINVLINANNLTLQSL